MDPGSLASIHWGVVEMDNFKFKQPVSRVGPAKVPGFEGLPLH